MGHCIRTAKLSGGEGGSCWLCGASLPCISVGGFISFFLFSFFCTVVLILREMCRQLAFVMRTMSYLSPAVTVRECVSQFRETKEIRVSQRGQNDRGTQLRGCHQTSDILHPVEPPLWKVDLGDPR